mmetsp:Transcript_6940/g.8893  ORF Transcript_6940/g.8893 Transcript_6940/m.8893 type:complete len:232 (+) Transcript_6940:58-753(+)
MLFRWKVCRVRQLRQARQVFGWRGGVHARPPIHRHGRLLAKATVRKLAVLVHVPQRLCRNGPVRHHQRRRLGLHAPRCTDAAVPRTAAPLPRPGVATTPPPQGAPCGSVCERSADVDGGCGAPELRLLHSQDGCCGVASQDASGGVVRAHHCRARYCRSHLRPSGPFQAAHHARGLSRGSVQARPAFSHGARCSHFRTFPLAPPSDHQCPVSSTNPLEHSPPPHPAPAPRP